MFCSETKKHLMNNKNIKVCVGVCVRAFVLPDPEKLSSEPSATDVVMSLLLIGSVLTVKERKIIITIKIKTRD